MGGRGGKRWAHVGCAREEKQQDLPEVCERGRKESLGPKWATVCLSRHRAVKSAGQAW